MNFSQEGGFPVLSPQGYDDPLLRDETGHQPVGGQQHSLWLSLSVLLDPEGQFVGDPPTILDNESTIDELMTRNSHDIAINTIFHARIDSRIDSDDG